MMFCPVLTVFEKLLYQKLILGTLSESNVISRRQKYRLAWSKMAAKHKGSEIHFYSEGYWLSRTFTRMIITFLELISDKLAWVNIMLSTDEIHVNRKVN